MKAPRTFTEQLDELRAEFRRDPLIDFDYLLSAEALSHAAGATLFAGLCFWVSYLLIP